MKKYYFKRVLIGISTLGMLATLSGCQQVKKWLFPDNSPNHQIETEPVYVPQPKYPTIPSIYQTAERKITEGVSSDFFSQCANILQQKEDGLIKYVKLKNNNVKINLATDFPQEDINYMQTAVNYLNEIFGIIGSNTTFTLGKKQAPLMNWFTGDSIYVYASSFSGKEYIEGSLGLCNTSLGNPKVYFYPKEARDFLIDAQKKFPKEKLYLSTLCQCVFIHEIMHACNFYHASDMNGIMHASLSTTRLTSESAKFSDKEIKSLIYQFASANNSFEKLYEKYCAITNYTPFPSYKTEFENNIATFINKNDKIAINNLIAPKVDDYVLAENQIIQMQSLNGSTTITLNKTYKGYYEVEFIKNNEKKVYQDKIEFVNIKDPEIGNKQIICLKNFNYYNNGLIETNNPDKYVVYTKYASVSGATINSYNWRMFNINSVKSYNSLLDTTLQYKQNKNLNSSKLAEILPDSQVEVYLPQELLINELVS